jgi:predicted transcriptional regulator
MKNRSRLEIAAKILDVAQFGAIKTRIMYDSFLSFPQLRDYLELLEENGALKYVDEERKYYTTRMGLSFLMAYKEIGQLISPRNKRTDSLTTQKQEAITSSMCSI